MKQHLKRFFHSRRSARVLALFLTAALSVSAFAGWQAVQFRYFTDTLFRQEMESDTLSMHYILAHPDAYGIADDMVCLTPYSPQGQEQAQLQLEQCRKKACSICPLFFRKDTRLLLTLLTRQLESSRAEAAFPFYAEPLSPGSGIQSSLPILLAEYTFRSKQDVDNYLMLLTQIPAYLEGIAAYEKEKAAAGLFMSDSAADKIIEQCYEILDAGQLRSGVHFLNVTFAQRLQNLVQRGLITAAEKETYLQQNHTVLLDYVLPAYERLGDEILLLKGSGTNPDGLAQFPKGREYYALLFARTTGCSRPLPEVEALLTARLQEDTHALAHIMQQAPDLTLIAPEEEFPAQAPSVCLHDLQTRMQEDFPAIPETETPPSCTVKKVSESLADYCAPAFYLTPPIDDITENAIYINEKDTPDGLELYTTLAHEGYPGHLYQTVYYQLCQQKNHINPARNLLHYGGYTEGWALYVEMLSYDYAKEYMAANAAAGSVSDDSLLFIDAMKRNRSIQLCLYALMDIEIHYNGADYESVHQALSKFGITEPQVTRNIYDYIVEEPVNYPKYYVGFLEFELLQEAAKEKWEEDYSDMRFHEAILETGPCPFDILWEELGIEDSQ